MSGRGRVLAALAAALLVTLAVPAAGQAKVKSSFFGATTVSAPTQTELESISQTGLGIYRLPLLWREVEPNAPSGGVLDKGSHRYEWRRYDAEIRRLTEAGLAAHVLLIGTPKWVAEDIHTSPWQSAAGRRGWPRYVAEVVNRYGPDGSFWRENPDLPPNPPVAYQVWNEQNSDFYYKPKANPQEYARLFVSAAEQVRAGDPKAQILSGGMFGTPQNEGSQYAWPFLGEFLRERGVVKHLDAVGIHPYAGSLRGIKYQFRKLRGKLKRAKLKRMPLQVTEIGWSSAPPRQSQTMFQQGRKGQARLVDKSMRLMLNKRRKWRIQRIIWFAWRDVSPDERRLANCNLCLKMGLLKEDLSPKPAYRRFSKRVSGALAGGR